MPNRRQTGSSSARLPSRKRIRPSRWRAKRKRCAALGVSPAGSTLTASVGTSWPRSSSAPRIVTAVVGQTSRQCVYMKVSTTTWPRRSRSATRRPSWSWSVRSCGGISGASAPAQPPSPADVPGRATSTTTSAATSASVAATIRARRTRAGIRAPGYAGSGFDEPAPDRVAHELDAVAHAELAQDVAAMPPRRPSVTRPGAPRRVAIFCKAMSVSGAEYVKQIRSQVEEVDPSEVRELASEGVVIVDVREQEEWDQGHLPGAVHIPRGYLESRIDGAAPDRGQRVILYCASGVRSAL